jgi:hypothetical protein
MNEDFVTYELAVKLKEKGFDEPCYGYYHCNGGNDSFEVCGNGDRDFLNSKNQYRVAAPTISQALKWLREEKGIHIEPVATTTFATKNNTAYFVLIKHKITATSMDSIDLLEKYALFNDACIAGIEYVLNNLI